MSNTARSLYFFAALPLALAACGGSRAEGPTPAAPAREPAAPAPAADREAEPTPPSLRLPDTARPERYRVSLHIVPEKTKFSGSVEIDLDVAEATDVLWLNATDLEIASAELRRDGDDTLEPQVLPGNEHVVGFQFDEQLAPGKATIAIEFRGELRRKEGRGIFVEKEGGDWYQFTQFEAPDARRAFPCFDEPKYKVPWTMSLTVKKDHTALANTPQVDETDHGDGTKTITFAESKPMPTYLVSFAVGPFDFHDAGESRNGVPIRIVTPEGRASQATFAAESTRELLAHLEDYFGIPYPYAKLDVITIPDTVGFTAMEHPGLVTFNQNAVLWTKEQETIGKKKRFAYIQAHELGHQWFGNLVTLPFWDDIWLNESFASWSEALAIAEYAPEWKPAVGLIDDKQRALKADSLATARTIREPIESYDDIANAFDYITYLKGQSILHMYENWLGEDTFQSGIRSYLRDNAWGIATHADFLESLEGAAEREVAKPFTTFLEQIGAPEVSFALSCDEGEPPELALSQKRYLPLGSEADPDAVWGVPVCVEYEVGGEVKSTCTMLDSENETLALDAKSCPTRVMPNAGGVGYYRSNLTDDLMDKLLTAEVSALSTPERLNLIYDFGAMVDSGAADLADALELVGTFADSKSRHITEASMSIVGGTDRMLSDELQDEYRGFVRELYSRRARKLGWKPRPNESLDTTELRPDLVRFVAIDGHDKRLIGRAKKLAGSWLDDREGVHPTMVRVALEVAAEFGDAELYERMLAEAKKEKDRRYRNYILNAISHFRQPELVRRSLDLVLTDTFDIRESSRLVYGAAGDERTREIAYEFVKANFDALAGKLPESSAAHLPRVAEDLCTEAYREDAQAFFEGKSTELEGGPRVLAQTLEQMDLCVAYREAQRDSAVSFFEDR